MTADYALGYSDAELERLIWQAELLRPYTERLLRWAGIEPGMRVLDVGCGPGDVTMLAASLVGRSGSVTGIDRDPRPLALAARRAESAGLTWVHFDEADLADFRAFASFDAVIGRYVMVSQADPAAFLRAAWQHVAPGGVLAVHELNFARPAVACPEVPLWSKADKWAKLAFASVTPHLDVGSRLIEHFSAAGLPEPALCCEVPVGGGKDSPLYRYLAETLRSLLPVLGRLGVSPDDVGVDTLENRLRTAVTQARSQIEWNPQFMAMARRPSRSTLYTQ